MKAVRHSQSTSFVDTPSCNNGEWFDNECTNAKNSYLDALRVFNNCKTAVSREYYSKQNMIYKRLVNKKKCSYKHRRLEDIEKFKLSKPRAFWKYFRKKNQKSKESISLNDCLLMFQTLNIIYLLVAMKNLRFFVKIMILTVVP